MTFGTVRGMFIRWISLLTTGLALAHPAAAGVVTYSGTLSEVTGGAIALDLFHPGAGTLQSVTVTTQLWIGGQVRGEASCDFFLPCQLRVELFTQAQGLLQRGSIALAGSAASSATNTCDIGYFQFNITCLATADVGSDGEVTDTATDSATLALFSGPGTFSIDYTALFVTDTPLVVQSVRAVASVTYTFDTTSPPDNAVPEPGSLALGGLACLLAAGMRRRRR